MKSTKTYFASLLVLVITLSCTPEKKTPEKTYADYLANGEVVRGLNFKDYVKLSNTLAKDTQALKETWVMWQAEKWPELENYINTNKLNSGYPPAEGFLGVEVVSLTVGTKIDRYNSVYGQFFAPKGTPFDERSLQPKDKYHPYTAYDVVKQIDSVLQGKAIPWYGQPGMGTQYMTKLHDNVLMNDGFLIMTDSIPASKSPAN